MSGSKTTTTTTPPMTWSEAAVAEVEAEVEQFRRQAYLRRGLSYPGPPSSCPSSSAARVAGVATAAQDDRQPKSFSQLLEDFIRTHSSTASPAGQRYASDMLQGTIGRRRVFGGGYIGSFS